MPEADRSLLVTLSIENSSRVAEPLLASGVGPGYNKDENHVPVVDKRTGHADEGVSPTIKTDLAQGMGPVIGFGARDNGQDAGVEVAPTLRACNSVNGNEGSGWTAGVAMPYQDVSGTLCRRDDAVTSNQIAEQNKLIPMDMMKGYENHPQDSRIKETEVSQTLGAEPSLGLPLAQNVSAFTQNQRDEVRLIDGDGQIAAALSTSVGPKQGNTLAIESEEIIGFQPGQLVRGFGPKPDAEVSATLKKVHNDQSPHLATEMAVRRLTPRECERLQGFPDDWTAILWKGKPPEECPDGPRYRATGNSMAVNVMQWIGMRIALVDEAFSEEEAS